MRQTKRGKEPICLNRKNISSAMLSVILKPGDADRNIYASPEVWAALKLMYLEKCYLCEKMSPRGNNTAVEHFIPYTKDNPGLAYKWSNLHWSCGSCNSRKTAEIYKKYTKAKVLSGTLLVDPSMPKPSPVRELIRFDKNLHAYNYLGQSLIHVENTVAFLNLEKLIKERSITKDALEEFLRECGSIPQWREIIKYGYKDPDDLPLESRPYYKEAFENAHRLWVGFLDAKCPHSMSMRDYLQERCNIAPAEIIRIGEAFLNKSGQKIKYIVDW